MNKFEFNDMKDFDGHIELSIPNYQQLFSQLSETIDSLDSHGGLIVDLGCSTGKLLKSLKSESKKIGVDCSNLIPEGYTENNCEFVNSDVLNYPLRNCTTIVSVFLLQFLTRKDRKTMLSKIKQGLASEGKFYCAEKIHYDDPILDSVTKEIHLQGKRKHFTDTEILDKSNQLMRSMWLSTDRELQKELSEIGKPTQIWRSYTFCCYAVTKD